MAFDPTAHVINPVTGFIEDKLGNIAGLVPAAAAKTAEAFQAFPKWVEAHVGHVVALEGKPKVVPLFPDFHVDRATGVVTVLVKDAEEEALALSEPKAPEQEKIEAVEEAQDPAPLFHSDAHKDS